MTGRLTVLAGPSGVGKGSVISAVRRLLPDVWLSLSVTTRPPREGEVEGVAYHFVDDAEFARMVAAGELLEHDAHMSASYGTPRGPVEAQLATGGAALLEIDVMGARQVRATMPEARLVLLVPPSMDELRRRLEGRGTESPQRLQERLARAELELAAQAEFDNILVNDDVERAAAALVALMTTPTALE